MKLSNIKKENLFKKKKEKFYLTSCKILKKKNERKIYQIALLYINYQNQISEMLGKTIVG